MIYIGLDDTDTVDWERGTGKLARQLAAEHGLFLRGLGGTEDGVIGALSAVGLGASGQDGRFILVGTIRELEGVQSIASVLASGSLPC